MTKHRIITDGYHFYIQRKGFWWWNFEGKVVAYDGSKELHKFDTRKEAQEWIDAQLACEKKQIEKQKNIKWEVVE